MDKRGVILHNGNILTELISDGDKGGLLYVPPLLRDQKYKRLKVVQGDEEIESETVLYVPLHAGTEVEINSTIFMIVNKREIILSI